MKLELLVSTGILLGSLLPGCPEGRALSQSLPEESLASQPPEQPPEEPWPLFLRLGQDYFLRLGSLRKSPPSSAAAASFSSTSTSSSHLAASASASASASGGHFFRAAVQQQLHQAQQPLRERERSLGGAGASLSEPSWEGEGPEGAQRLLLEALPGKEKRSEEPPISLDLTFHLLREVLEMARAEQLAQQAHSNRKLMEIIGK